VISLVEDIAKSVALTDLKPGSGRRICIITNAPICCNPRVVKEADALSAAGYEVRVVASQHARWVVEWDEKLMAERTWKLDAIRCYDSEAGNLRLRSGLRQRAFKLLSSFSNENLFPERAYARLFHELFLEATKTGADLFIAHNPQALPVAAEAAKHFGVDFAFDSEDLHTGEFSIAEQQSQSYRLLKHLETKYLPNCVYVTSASDGISQALANRYKLTNTRTIYNVFSWSERETIDGSIKDRRGPALSLYWCSQIIGLDRGLQDVIRAISVLSAPVQLHIRGALNEHVRRELMDLATAAGVADRIYFHAPVPPDELLSRACEHDVGLALEQVATENHNLTVANKIFHYLIAGLAVAATATEGQRLIVEQCKDAGFLYEPGDHKALAAGLQQLIDSPSLLKLQKRAALDAGRCHWNWEKESQTLLELVGAAVRLKDSRA
jgi:glycosyltransferase involved in cell wall biosynthesis